MIGGFIVGVLVVHGADEGLGGDCVQPSHRVEVGDEAVAELHRFLGDGEGGGIMSPGFADVEGVFGAVEAEDGAEDAKLHPTGVKFGIFDAAVVAADVVAPPAVADVGGGGGEVGLEGEGFP